MLRKLMVLGIFAAAALAIAAPAQAQTITSQTQVSINVQPFVILYFRNSVQFDVTDAQLAALIGASANPVNEGDATGLTLSETPGADAGVTGAGFTAPSGLKGTVNNFWGVRSVGDASLTGETQVSVSITTGTLTNPSADTIAIANAVTKLSADAAFAGSQVQFPATGLGAASLQLGDVQFDVDMTNVSTSGNYTGGVIEVVAQNI